jgi:hypothetical protein
MIRMRLIAVCVAVFLLQSCANYMYTGELSAQDSTGVERKVIVYWPMTDPFIGKRKAGPVMLLTACGIPIQFDQQPEGIVFRGNPNDDMIAEGVTPNQSEFECGRFGDNRSLVDIKDESVSFTIACRPVNDEFSAITRSYIAARDESYEISASSQKSTSFLGKTLEGPDPPDCAERD